MSEQNTVPQKVDASRIYIVNVTCHADDQEHHLVLYNVKGLRMQSRIGETFRYAFEPNKVGTATPVDPYATSLAGVIVPIENIDIDELHLFLAGVAADTIEVMVWK